MAVIHRTEALSSFRDGGNSGRPDVYPTVNYVRLFLYRRNRKRCWYRQRLQGLSHRSASTNHCLGRGPLRMLAGE
jgi:hypothetical protein